MPQTPRALLFDLGGVLIDIDFRLAFKAWAAHSALTQAELAQAFQFDLAYQLHERGEMSANAYFAHLAKALRLSASLETIEAGWNAIFVGEIKETLLLVQQARKKLPCYAFTNTNAVHMRQWSALYPGVVAAFDRVFASHQIGLRKPEGAAFDFISQAIGVAPGDILFFDDLAENTQAAQAAGLQTVLVRSSQDVAHALKTAGLA